MFKFNIYDSHRNQTSPSLQRNNNNNHDDQKNHNATIFAVLFFSKMNIDSDKNKNGKIHRKWNGSKPING